MYNCYNSNYNQSTYNVCIYGVPYQINYTSCIFTTYGCILLPVSETCQLYSIQRFSNKIALQNYYALKLSFRFNDKSKLPRTMANTRCSLLVMIPVNDHNYTIIIINNNTVEEQAGCGSVSLPPPTGGLRSRRDTISQK